MKKIQLFWDIVECAVEHEPNKLAIVCNDESYTYFNLLRAAELFSNDLIKMGLQAGDHVALWSMNHACWPIAYLGIVRAGGVAVLFNYALPAEDILLLMRNTDVKFIAYGKNRELEANPLAVEAMARELGISVAQICDIRQDFNTRINSGEQADRLPPLNPDSKRTATIIFSTGTTANSKAVQQSQLAMCNNIICTYERLKDIHEMKKLIAVPLFHSYGLEVMLYNFMKLSSIWLADTFKPDKLLEIIHHNQIDSFNTATVTCRGIINHPQFTSEIANRFSFTGIGGSQASLEEMKTINDAFPNAQMLQGYGQTEACTFITTFFPGDSIEKMTTTEGKVLPCHEVKIIDSKGKWLDNGKNGEVVYRGSSMMNGYYKLPPEEQPFDKDGWIHTGDLGCLDEDGYLSITGRIKDIIIKSGENIMPSEIEAKILACGGVQAAKVLGVPHPTTGESVEACIIPEAGTWAGEEELMQQLNGKLNSFMMPSHFFLYDQFPLTENGKINQRVLKKDVISKLKKEIHTL